MTPNNVAGKLVLGGTLGWLCSPLLWIAVPWPLFVVYLLARSWQESQWGKHNVGQANEIGPLQYTRATWERLSGEEISGIPDPREDPFWSAYYFASELQGALMESLAAWRIAIPIWGYSQVVGIWRAGPEVSAGKANSLAAEAREEQGWQIVRAWGWVALLVSLAVPAVILMMLVGAAYMWWPDARKWMKKTLG